MAASKESFTVLPKLYLAMLNFLLLKAQNNRLACASAFPARPLEVPETACDDCGKPRVNQERRNPKTRDGNQTSGKAKLERCNVAVGPRRAVQQPQAERDRRYDKA